MFLVQFMMQLLAQSPGRALETPAMLLTLPPDCAPPASMPPSFAAPGLTLHTHAHLEHLGHHTAQQSTTKEKQPGALLTCHAMDVGALSLAFSLASNSQLLGSGGGGGCVFTLRLFRNPLQLFGTCGGAHVLSRPLFVLAPVVVLSCPRLPADDQPHFSSRAPWACSARPSTRNIMQARMTAVGIKLRYLLQPC